MVNPNDVVAQYGADTMRMYIMFIGDFEKAAAVPGKAETFPGPASGIWGLQRKSETFDHLNGRSVPAGSLRQVKTGPPAQDPIKKVSR